MMSAYDRVALEQRINYESTTWGAHTQEQCAAWVIAWCDGNDIPAPLTANMLARAMAQMPYWNQGPANYLDMIFAATALLARQGE